MAEVAIAGGNRKAGAPTQRKKSTRIDMTAMVDVAFLLLTFFILTTTMASPKVMQLTLPPAGGEAAPVAQTKVMTIFLGENDAVHCCYFLEGNPEPIIETTNFSPSGIRTMIQAHLHRGQNTCPQGATAEEIKASGCWDPIFVLKPTQGSKYQNMVDILDEMSINKVKKYALTEITTEDSLLMLEHHLK